MRIISDHSRGMSFLLAAGVVPSNEDRGYVLRRVMRRAIQQGRALGLEGDWLRSSPTAPIEIMGYAHPQLAAGKDRIDRWVRVEEESFGRTLDRGTALLEELVEKALEESNAWIPADDAFQLHDTYGFPYEMTKELVAERGLSVDDQGFEELMEQQRNRARLGSTAGARTPTATSKCSTSHRLRLRRVRRVRPFLRSETGIGALDRGQR